MEGGVFFQSKREENVVIFAEGNIGGQERKGRLRRIGEQIIEYSKEKEEVFTQGNGPVIKGQIKSR